MVRQPLHDWRRSTDIGNRPSRIRNISTVFRPSQIALSILGTFAQTVKAQAPAPDLTGYPSGLASIAAVTYYSISSNKDDLSHRRRLAGFGVEHISRDLARGPRRGKDTQLKGICFDRKQERYQRGAWARRVCGRSPYNVHADVGIPTLNGNEIIMQCAKALSDLPEATRQHLDTLGFRWSLASLGTDGHWLAAVAAFCQIVDSLLGGNAILLQCREKKDDWEFIAAKYHDILAIVEGRTNALSMPEIRDKSLTELESLLIRVDTWEGGGRPIYISCYTLIRVLGHCVELSYGELMVSAHAYLSKAQWATSLYIEFGEPIEATSSQEEVIFAVKEAIRECRFYHRDCDLRVWGHRFGDLSASVVSGAIIATLISLGSTAGSWVAVTAAAVADPKPVAGLTSASWGYPNGRRAHMEAHSDPIRGQAAVCLSSQSWARSFQQDSCQDIFWQFIVGLVSVVMLAFKFPVRSALGFGVFSPPTTWIFWFGIATTTLGILISIQIPIWAWTYGGRWSVIHGIAMIGVAMAPLIAKLANYEKTGINNIWTFWVTDICVWIYSFLGASFSFHLGESTEYPVTGWIWPTMWLLALGSCGAGIPRPLPDPGS